jgi:adenylate cyclase
MLNSFAIWCLYHIKAAMLLADLRGFSRLTDELPEKRSIELLNAFFDLVVPGVTGSGGDVLKYIGDAVIAILAGRNRVDCLLRA